MDRIEGLLQKLVTEVYNASGYRDRGAISRAAARREVLCRQIADEYRGMEAMLVEVRNDFADSFHSADEEMVKRIDVILASARGEES